MMSCLYKSCLPDSSSKSLLVILMCPLLIESFLPRGSKGISMTGDYGQDCLFRKE